MPTYEYECSGCGKHFEYFQSMSEAPKDKCEECGEKLTKLLSAGSGLIFKGSGFYITDYKSKSGGESSTTAGEAKGDAKGGSETKKSDAKPAESSTSTPSSSPSSTPKGE